MLAIVGIGLLVMPGEAAATTDRGNPGQSVEARHDCACGMGCKSICCCARKKSAEVSRSLPRSTPCLTDSPCDGNLPTSTGVLTLVSDPADRVALIGFPAAPLRFLLTPPGSDQLRTEAGSRIDDPPEDPGDA